MSDLFIGPTRLTVNIEDRSGTRIGAGPLVTVLSLDYGYRLSESGDFSAVLALSDPRAARVLPKSAVLAFYFDETFLFRGIVENTAKSVDAGGVLRMTVKGRDMSGELAEAPVGNLDVTDGSGGGVTDGPARILTAANIYRGSGGSWTLDTSSGFATTGAQLYGQYSGESALTALIMAAQKTGEHWRIMTDGSRKIVWLRTSTPDHNLRAIPTAGEPVAAEGNPNICYIQGFSEEVDAYRMITRIYPWGAGDGDMRLTLKATTRVAPSGFTLDKNENVLENFNAVLALGKSIGVHLRFQDIRPISNTSADTTAAANQLYDAALAYLQRHDFAADLKTYKLKVIQLPDNVHVGEVITVEYQDQGFVIDGEQMVILAIRNRIDSSGARTSDLTVSGVARWQEDVSREVVAGMEQGKLFTAHPQRGPNSYVTNYQRFVWNDGSNSEVASIRFRFGPEVCQLNQVAFDFETDNGTRMLPLESTVRSVGGSSATTTTDGASVPTTTTDGSATPTSGDGGGTSTTSGASSKATADDGGSVTTLPLSGSSTTDSGGPSGIYAPNTGSVTATAGVAHNHPEPHIHNIPHNHTLTLAAHGHGMAHEHSLTLGVHQHTVTIIGHHHDVTIIGHHHDVTPVITTVYGVYRESNALTFNITDLDYRVNGEATWHDLNGAVTSLGSNWVRLDMTEVLYDANFVPLRSNNLLEFRRKTAGSFASRVSCMIDGQLLVRTIIQSIALT